MLGSINTTYFGDTSINPLHFQRSMSNYSVEEGFLACFLPGICPLHAPFLLPVERLDSLCFSGSIECCSSDAAYEWCQICTILLGGASIVSLSSLWVPPLLKSVDLTHVFDSSGWKKKRYYNH